MIEIYKDQPIIRLPPPLLPCSPGLTQWKSPNYGNDNEQNTLIPLEKKMIEKFDMSRFVVCTDAGLSSATNRYFNNYDKEDGCRSFITTQTVAGLYQNKTDRCAARSIWLL